MPLTYLENTVDPAVVAGSLRCDGAVVVKELAELTLSDKVTAELRQNLDSSGLDNRSEFNDSRTLRTGAVLADAPSAAPLLDHDMVGAVANEILLPFCATYQVGSITAIEILPGESAQALHRDDSLYPIEINGMELEIGFMWALNDFTRENGGTRVVPGNPALRKLQ